ncbi:MAG TPA: hypothetical protein VFB14_15410 [Bryobacteraceae bacterium]|nr:hypothetical protein [Bryobacteraceae bacterium]
MRITAVLLMLLLGAGAGFAATPSEPAFGPLWVYNGTWKITKAGATPGTKPEELTNQCSAIGKYFVCQQSVNGTAVALWIATEAGTPGRYHTQSVRPDGIAGGRGDLEISGDRWVFTSVWNQGGGKLTYNRTTNIFTGKNNIHFEQAESTNNRDWTVKSSGNEVRVGRAGR